MITATLSNDEGLSILQFSIDAHRIELIEELMLAQNASIPSFVR